VKEAADDGTEDDALPEKDGYDEADDDETGTELDRDADTLSLLVEGSCVLVVVSMEISTEMDVAVVVVVVMDVLMDTLKAEDTDADAADDDAAGCAAHDRRELSMPKMHWHVDEHSPPAAPFLAVPSSHCSPFCLATTPSPQPRGVTPRATMYGTPRAPPANEEMPTAPGAAAASVSTARGTNPLAPPDG
jgi:hypothetical protein